MGGQSPTSTEATVAWQSCLLGYRLETFARTRTAPSAANNAAECEQLQATYSKSRLQDSTHVLCYASLWRGGCPHWQLGGARGRERSAVSVFLEHLLKHRCVSRCRQGPRVRRIRIARKGTQCPARRLYQAHEPLAWGQGIARLQRRK